MITGKLDVSIWNLGVPLALLAACGPAIDENAAGEDGSACESREDCSHLGSQYECHAGTCVEEYYYYDDHDCGTGSCCSLGCYEPEYECRNDFECPLAHECVLGECQPLPGPDACALVPVIEEIPLLEGDYSVVRALAFVEAMPSPGRELLVGTQEHLLMIGSDGTTTSLATQVIVDEIEVADLDTDGDEDIVFLEASGFMHALLADGIGGFTEAPPLATDALEFVLADVDADGWVDIVSNAGAALTWQRGIDPGVFGGENIVVEAAVFDLLRIPASTSASDDVLYSISDGGLHFARGDDMLASQPLAPSVTPHTGRLTAGDYDGDGVFEAAALLDPPVVHLWRDLPSVPQTSTTWALTSEYGLAASGDVDGDGWDDLVLASAEGKLGVRYGSAAAEDEPLGCYTEASLAGGSAHVLVAGDFDGDGRDDVISALGSGTSPSVWWTRMQ